MLLRAEGARLLLKATDLDVEITETVTADIGQAGATTVPAQILFDIVRKLPDGAEVAIDTLTGESRVLRADLVQDCGASLNPAIDLGQIEGAFVQGAFKY